MTPNKSILKSNIVLIGMPGAGKSTVGVYLAKCVAKDFLDTDIAIRQREGKTLNRDFAVFACRDFAFDSARMCDTL